MPVHGAAPCPHTAGGPDVRPAKAKIKKFRMDPKYTHHRSEGLTRRQNSGTKRLVIDDRNPTRRSGDPPMCATCAGACAAAGDGGTVIPSDQGVHACECGGLRSP